MNYVKVFDFVGAGSQPVGDEYVTEVPVGITSAEALLNALYDGLQLPGYFGFNWDALSDCLRDLTWIQQETVVLRHMDLPALPVEECRIYLEVLADAAHSWQPGEGHSLRIEFPGTACAAIRRLERAKPSGP